MTIPQNRDRAQAPICPCCKQPRSYEHNFAPFRESPGSPKEFVPAWVCHRCGHAILDDGSESCHCSIDGQMCRVHTSDLVQPEIDERFIA